MTTPAPSKTTAPSVLGRWHGGKLGSAPSVEQNTPTATTSLGVGSVRPSTSQRRIRRVHVRPSSMTVQSFVGDETTTGNWAMAPLTNRNTPTQTISLGRPAVAIEAGSHFSVCALLDNGSVSCWGRNHKGQPGQRRTRTQRRSGRTPALTLPMPGGSRAVAIDIGHYMVCAVLEDGHACWGQYGGPATRTPSLKTFFGFFNETNSHRRFHGPLCRLWAVGRRSRDLLGHRMARKRRFKVSRPTLATSGRILGSGRTAVDVEIGR